MALSRGVCATPVSEDVIRWLWQMFVAASPLAAASLAGLGHLDQRETLRGLTMPILSFVGARDAVVDPQVCRSVADYNAGARIVEFAECGHAPFLEEPGRYNGELLGFLDQCLS